MKRLPLKMVRKDSYVIFYFVIQFVFIFNLISGKHKNKIKYQKYQLMWNCQILSSMFYFATSSENSKMTHILFAMKYYGGPLWNCVTQHKIIKMLAFPSNIFG